jgi:hypothetical protein
MKFMVKEAKYSKAKYSLKKINHPKESDIVSCYVVVDQYGNHHSEGGSEAIHIDNHFVVMRGNYPEEGPLHRIEKVYDEDVSMEVIDKTVKNLAQRELEGLVKQEEISKNSGLYD